MDRSIQLVQPRHIYAPPFSDGQHGHIYMPTALLSVGAKLREMGFHVEFVDENIGPVHINMPLVGINLLGAPYVPVARRYGQKMRERHDADGLLIIGGQVVSGMTENEISRICGPFVVGGDTDDALAKALGVQGTRIPATENTSIIPAYERLPSDLLRLYLANEFPFYLSQGCRYACSFCAGRRSRSGVNGVAPIRENERYRNLDMALGDFEYLLERARDFGLTQVDMYLSNLDLFQTPRLLGEFCGKAASMRRRFDTVRVRMRGLSTVRSFLRTHRSNPDVIRSAQDAGLYRVGFGIDGAAPRIWRTTRKPQNQSECIQAIHFAKTAYGIEPEVLMVFGHNDIEDKESLELAYLFARDMYENYGALPRPHVAKDMVPGNDGWSDPVNARRVEQLVRHPELFQNLDFTCVPSPITHPDSRFRDLVTEFYIKVCELPECLTQYVLPVQDDGATSNIGKYDI